jgi:hypothetical protein
VDVNVGDFILAINGVELRAPDNIIACWTARRIARRASPSTANL